MLYEKTDDNNKCEFFLNKLNDEVDVAYAMSILILIQEYLTVIFTNFETN